MALKPKYATDFETCYAPRIGLWLSKQWPFRSTKYDLDITYAYTLGISSPGQMGIGTLRLLVVHFWAMVTSGLALFVLWKLSGTDDLSSLLIKVLVAWPFFHGLAGGFHATPSPSREGAYSKGWRLWIWGRGLEYLALTASIAIVVFVLLADEGTGG